MAALVLGLGLATVTVGVSVATAGQREDAVRLIGPGSSSGTDFATRLSTASAADYQLFCAADEGSMDRIACSMLLWDEALAEQSASSPAFCAPTQSDAGLEIIADGGRAAVLTAMPGSGSAKDAARRAMIVAFPCRGEPRAIPAEAVARAAASLGTEWEQRHGVLSREESAARRAAYDAATGADYQRMCASRDPGEDGFCAGVLFRANLAEAKAAAPTFCAPSFEGPEATSRFVATAKAGVAQVRVTANQSPLDVARSGLVRAYPCASGRTEAGPDVVVQMPVELVMGGASIGPGDEVRVALSDRDGILAQTLARGSDHGPTRAVSIPLTTDQFPGLGEGNRSYTLTGEVRDAQGVIRQIASPVVIRLGPGSQVSARNLSSTLDFGPV